MNSRLDVVNRGKLRRLEGELAVSIATRRGLQNEIQGLQDFIRSAGDQDTEAEQQQLDMLRTKLAEVQEKYTPFAALVQNLQRYAKGAAA